MIHFPGDCDVEHSAVDCATGCIKLKQRRCRTALQIPRTSHPCSIKVGQNISTDIVITITMDIITDIIIITILSSLTASPMQRKHNNN